MERIVITGIGVVSAVGAGKDGFWRALEAGASGLKPISIFETDNMRCKLGAEVSNFRAENYFSKKGLGYLSRTAELACSAATLCVADLQHQGGAVNPAEIGLALGSNLGSLQSTMLFEREVAVEGPRFVNPMLFPNTVINCIVGYISILLGCRGFNATISTATSASGFDTIRYALDILRKDEDVNVVLCGGSEELSLFSYRTLMRARQLAGSIDGLPEICAPFDRNRSGFIAGEGTCFLALERLEHARARNASPLAEIVGYGSFVNPYGDDSETFQLEGAAAAMNQALIAAELEPNQIDYLLGSANGSIRGDRIEAAAIERVFYRAGHPVPVASIKPMVGECLSASGIMQVAAGALSLQHDVIPPTLNFTTPDDASALLDVCVQRRAFAGRTVMINNFDLEGVSGASLILRKLVP